MRADSGGLPEKKERLAVKLMTSGSKNSVNNVSIISFLPAFNLTFRCIKA